MVTAVRVSKAQRAYDAIRGWIMDGTYPPGSRLVLDQLARNLSMSPVPIREAVWRLEAEGWVEFRHHIGAQVASVGRAQYGEAMQALALLEGYATATAAAHVDVELSRQARFINEQMGASLAAFDPNGFTRQNHEFHMLLCSRCPNTQVLAILERQWSRMDHLRRSVYALVPGRAQQSVEEHAALLDLIETSAGAAEIEACARQHKINTWRSVVEHG